ncbi:neurofilament medium polypeptide-like [Capsella rubella]|uniref:neurofilament medium polypeptide-like n=1 Tax=Capsella rubella TaxID=81985 RepID=UPI000CD54EA5|nr:neurofilament medium polypeptide-like [Capsella rubella]
MASEQAMRYPRRLYEEGMSRLKNKDSTPSEKFEPSVDYKQLLTEELKVPGGEGPTYDELLRGLSVCQKWSVKKRKWLGLLIILAIALYCVHNNSRIPFEAAKRVLDDESMQTYPWGRVAFETLVDNIKCFNPSGKTYTLGGPVYVLQAWAYDSIKCLGERYGNLVDNEEIPLLRWRGTRTRASFDEAIAEDIRKYGEVRVSKMVMKGDVSELFHTWPNQEEEDSELSNLVNDIHKDVFIKGLWDVKANEKKKAGNVIAAVESESPAKKQKVERVLILANSEEDDSGEKSSIKLLLDMVSTMNSRPVTFDVKLQNVDDKLQNVDDKFKNVDEEFSKMKDIISILAKSGGLAGLMSGKKIPESEPLPIQTIPNIRIRDAFERKTEQQTPEFQRKTSSRDYSVTSPPKTRPLTRNLEAQQRKEAEAQKRKEEGHKRKEEAQKKKEDAQKKKEADAQNRKEVEEKKRAEAEAKRKEETKRRGRKPKDVKQLKVNVPSDLVEDVQESVGKIPTMRLKIPKEEKTEVKEVEENKEVKEVEEKKEDNKAADIDLEDITDNNPFDTFEVLPESDDDEEEKIRNERIKAIRTANLKFATDGSSLYLRHLGAYMRLLRKRSMEEPSPYHTKCIAFIDPCFSALLIQDHNETFITRPKRFKFNGPYEDIVNGKMPQDQPTGLMWIQDVDVVYFVIQTEGDHWVALEVNLIKSHIDVYDSIVGHVTPESEARIMKFVKPFARMIPEMLNAIVPPSLRAHSSKMFSFRRRSVSKVPQNRDPGDCGVYALKYLECLALGVSFDGLCDSNMQAIWLKMAAYIMVEALNMYDLFM